MRELIAVGTYISPEGGRGVWGQISVDVAGRPVLIDVRITDGVLTATEADGLARRIHRKSWNAELVLVD